ncbi:hypothetical protein AC1031_021465 [Aphanomyces cochlioides]|nr:hypothetical protein AC1031_021465 [Aphanomyces cochlioides]
MHRISSNDDKKRDRSLSMSLSSSSYVSPQRRQPKKKLMLDREKLLDMNQVKAAIDAEEYPETPEYFRQQRRRMPQVPRVSPLQTKTAAVPILEQQSFLQTRVHTLTQALIKANLHHKRTQEHLTWALEEHATVQFEKQQLEQQLSDMMTSTHMNGHRVIQPSGLPDNISEQAELLAEQACHLRVENHELKTTFMTEMQALQASLGQLTMSWRAQQQSQARAMKSRHHEQEITALEAKCNALMAERKLLHNTIQELRGNIRVFCRLRPVGRTQSAVRVESDTRLTIQDSSVESAFIVDKIFDQASTQHDVYVEVQPLITSAMDGYNVCILAYGQTGSGKTHTMMGSLHSDANQGLCTRVFRDVFNQLHGDNNQSEVEVHISCVEIYNEKLVDLVQPSPTPLDVRMDKKSGVSVPNRTWVAVSKVDECVLVMEKALRHRSVAANDLNDASSRSHCITSLKVRRTDGALVMESKINLVDLAGSERLGTSNSEGERRSEATHINKSLLALRHVLLQLKNKQEYISYRDSKLTMLLQDAIGGHAKTLLFVCVNPATKCALESKCSLAFGERTNSVELGKAKQNVSRLKK